MKKRMSGIIHKQYKGKIFKIPFLLTDSREQEAQPAIAVSEPDEYGDIEFLFITTKETKGFGRTLNIPEGLLPFDSILHIEKKYLFNKSIIIKEIGEVDKSFLERVLKELTFKDAINYYKFIHKSTQTSEFIPGKSRINYAGRVFDDNELVNLIDSALEFYLTAGRYDKIFCEKLSAILSYPNSPWLKVLTTNSGSSANLLAISALTSHKLGDLRLKDSEGIITVAAGFPTSIAPIIQNRLIPIFVDIELGTYNIDPNLIEKAISNKTRAIFIAHTLGIPFNIDRILEIAERYKLWVIEDNCDALGAEYSLKRGYNLIKEKTVSGKGYTGGFGHIGTSSFYPAHQITMGEGGAVYTYDTDLYKILVSLRDWGRDCWCEPGSDNTCGKRFGWKHGTLPEGYDHKYTYSHIGYNLKITDMQAAIGVAQLEKLFSFVKARRDNWFKLNDGLKDLEDIFILPKYPDNAQISPFGFALTLRKNVGFTREDITRFLENNNIQTRTVFAGNMLRQPALVEGSYKFKVSGRLRNTDIVMNSTFWIGVYPGIRYEMVQFMIDKIREFCKR